MRIIFENGEILEAHNVARIYFEKGDEAYVRSGMDYLLKEEYARGFQEGSKAAIEDYKAKHGNDRLLDSFCEGFKMGLQEYEEENHGKKDM